MPFVKNLKKIIIHRCQKIDRLLFQKHLMYVPNTYKLLRFDISGTMATFEVNF